MTLNDFDALRPGDRITHRRTERVFRVVGRPGMASGSTPGTGRVAVIVESEASGKVGPIWRANADAYDRANPPNKRWGDPTRYEMIGEYLIGRFPEAEEMDREEAAYWFAANYHGGQGSNLYAALSQSPFKPGPLARGPEGYAAILYDSLVGHYVGRSEGRRVRGSRRRNPDVHTLYDAAGRWAETHVEAPRRNPDEPSGRLDALAAWLTSGSSTVREADWMAFTDWAMRLDPEDWEYLADKGMSRVADEWQRSGPRRNPPPAIRGRYRNIYRRLRREGYPARDAFRIAWAHFLGDEHDLVVRWEQDDVDDRSGIEHDAPLWVVAVYRSDEARRPLDTMGGVDLGETGPDAHHSIAYQYDAEAQVIEEAVAQLRQESDA